MSLAKEIERYIAPLAVIFTEPWRVAELLYEIGVVDWQIDDLELPNALTDLATTANDGIATLQALEDGELSAAEAALRTVEAAHMIVDAVQALQDMASQGLEDMPYPFNGPETWQSLARALPAYLFAQWMQEDHPTIRAWLRLGGALEPNGEGGEIINFGALSSFVTNPTARLAAMTADQPEIVLDALRDAAFSLGVGRTAQRLWVADGAVVALEPARPAPTPPGFWLSVLGSEPVDGWMLDLDVASPASGEAGVQVTGTLSGSAENPIPLSDIWSITAVLDVEGKIELLLTPSGPASAPGAEANDLTITLAGTPPEPWTLIGSEKASRLELAALTFELTGQDLVQSPDISFILRTEQLRMVINGGEGDSFVNYLLGAADVSADTTFDLAWSAANGFTFGGSAGLEVTIPIHRSLGPVSFETMTILLGATEEGLTAEISAWIGMSLGPLDIVMDGIGFAVAMRKAAEPGRGLLGDLDFVTLFKPPDGVGLAIDAGPVSGGGMLYILPELGEYNGVLDLDLLSIGISAVGLIDTKLPGGGWSVFLALFIDLPSIPLGFGFTLNGVGGVAGINRSIDVEALQAAIRAGSLDSILFPEDPIADAPIIIDAFKAIFPSAEGRYVFGPVVQIGWGSPTLIEAVVGVIIELPDPIKIAILGSLTSVLPTSDTDLVALHLEVAGIIDMGAGTLSIDASLHGSHIAGFPLSGDMGLRSAFGNAPSFLMALGGSHPAFIRPSGFPEIERLSLAINAGSVIDIRFDCYFAITSNSLHFGAAFEMTAEVEGFGINGGAEFDALITFSPFSLRTGLSYHISVKAVGVDLMAVWLEVTLSGPNPWHVEGTATFTILGIDNTIRLDKTIGSKKQEELPDSVDVLGQLREALERLDAWQIGAGGGQGVTLAASESLEDTLVVTPDGTLSVSQKIVPLNITIDKADPLQITGGFNRFNLETGEAGMTSTGNTTDWFTVSSYMDLKPSERLSAPSFEQLKSGITFGGGESTAGKALEGTLDFDQSIRDPNLREENEKLGVYNLTDDPRQGGLVNMLTGTVPLGFSIAADEIPKVVKPGYAVTHQVTGEVIVRSQHWTVSRASTAGRKKSSVVVPEWEIKS